MNGREKSKHKNMHDEDILSELENIETRIDNLHGDVAKGLVILIVVGVILCVLIYFRL
jgi:hypothetical protein